LEGIPNVLHGDKVTLVSLGYPLSVFNDNSTLREKLSRAGKANLENVLRFKILQREHEIVSASMRETHKNCI